MLFVTVALLFGCNATPVSSVSHLRTVDIPNSPAKNQIIGNCWAFATLGWIESQHLQARQELLDLSEAYITYRHFEGQLEGFSPVTSSGARQVQAGGDFPTARAIIANYGLMREEDFRPIGVVSLDPKREETAMNAINSSLKNGPLAKIFTDKIPANAKTAMIRAALDEAFHVDLNALADRIIAPQNLVVGTSSNGEPISLSQELYRWKYVEFPINQSSMPGRTTGFPFRAMLNDEQELILRKVMRSLNAHKPVFVAWLVDINAVGSEGDFTAAQLQQKGAGSQGLHITLLEDYTAAGIDPVSRTPFTTAEGELSIEEQNRAAEYGEITSFIIKNSWGQNPTATYARNGEYGFNRLAADYLFSWIVRTDTAGKPDGSELVLRSFVLP